MKPAPFEYLAPKTVDEVLGLLAERGLEAKILAGGQSLVPVMNFRLAQPPLLVDLNRVAGLDFVEPRGGGLAIGALTRQRTVERSPLVAERAPLLAEAMPWIAHPQIRNRGTIGGSLAHADPAAELPAVALALNARLRLRSATSDRWVPASDFFTGLFATALEPEELLVEVEIPERPNGEGWAFVETARRHGDYAQVGLAALVELDEAGVCRDASLVFLSVADTPFRSEGARSALVGKALTVEVIARAAEAVRADVDPTGDIHASADFKRHLAGELTERALQRAAARVGDTA